jgi:hypothetical protein
MKPSAKPDLDLPFLWPEARFHAGHAAYPERPPFRAALLGAALLAGVITGFADGALEWLREVIHHSGARRIRLIFAVYPAGPTRAEHLIEANMLAAVAAGTDADVQFRVLAVDRAYGVDCELPSLPPTIFYARAADGTPMLCVGSIGDGGCGPLALWSFNAVFQPDDNLSDAWRRWFEYMFDRAAPLTAATAQIPRLSPPSGNVEGARLWQEFAELCRADATPGNAVETQVDPVTGEVAPTPTAEGTPATTWDLDAIKLDPLAREFSSIYATGKLVTVDESSRLKPLVVSVTASTFGEQSQKAFGNVRQRQQFSLEILDGATTKAVEKCRLIGDVVGLLSLPLSDGIRWIPQTAVALLELEIAARNTRGEKLLGLAVGGNVDEFIGKREKGIRENLNAMYRDLGHGDQVPEERVALVIEDVRDRLTRALAAKVAPRPIFNPISAPNLTTNARDEAWAQPLSLALHAARNLRKSISDPFFARAFKPLAFKQEEFEVAMDVFGDSLNEGRDLRRATAEIAMLAQIETSEDSLLEKCRKVMALIRGKQGQSA